MLTLQLAPILQLADNFTINLANDRWQQQGFRCCISANSGSGKSNLVSVMVEELNNIGLPFVVIDPDAEYESFGKLRNVLVVSDNGGDIRLGPRWIAETLDKLAQGYSIVIDLGTLDELDQRAYYKSFVEKLFEAQGQRRQANRLQSLFLIVEEATIFAPQKMQKDCVSLAITKTIARRGRKYGINWIVICQRPGDMEKDILAQANIRFTGYIELERDFNAVKSLFPKGFKHGDLLSLETGQFYLSEGGKVHLVQVRKRRTEDLGATPAMVYSQASLFEVKVK